MRNGSTAAARARHILYVSGAAVALLLSAHDADAHTSYIANHNHTDYGWNASPSTYDAQMVADLDYYLGRFTSTAGNPDDERARFNADGWYWLRVYERNKTQGQFEALIDRVKDGHIAFPLNALVNLYGGMPTEAAIRVGYYPGRIARQYGITFPWAEEMENMVQPWGLAMLWPLSGSPYSWKGICNCATSVTRKADDAWDVVRWIGPDGSDVLLKWYTLSQNNNQGWGGYSEMRANATSSGINTLKTRDTGRSLPISGAFGYGWDDVNSQTTALETAVADYNDAYPSDRARLATIPEYFAALEPSRASLSTQTGGWGNDWDLGPVTLAASNGVMRRGVETARAGEALAAVVSYYRGPTFWTARRSTLDDAWEQLWKFFEHSWYGTDGTLQAALIGNKQAWAAGFADAMADLRDDAGAAFARLFTTSSDGNRFVVFNSLSWTRTDIADLPLASGEYLVWDQSTMPETLVPSQVVTLDGTTYLRILASNVPSLGYKVFRYATPVGTPTPTPTPAATVTTTRIANGEWRVDIGTNATLTSIYDVANGIELLAATGLGGNVWGSGTAGNASAENSGPVSTTAVVTVTGTPDRHVRITLIPGVNRVEIDNTVDDNYTGTGTYSWEWNLTTPTITHEEVGAVMTAKTIANGGDYQSTGSRLEYLTLNHYVAASSTTPRTIYLSSRDASFFRVGNSTVSSLDTGNSQITRVLAMAPGSIINGGIDTQGDVTTFPFNFAVTYANDAASAATGKRFGMAHQNRLIALPLTNGTVGPLTATSGSFLTVGGTGIATAVKPVEEGERGVLVRFWQPGSTGNVTLSGFRARQAWDVNLIETDAAHQTISNDTITVSSVAKRYHAVRYLPPPPWPRAQVVVDVP